MKIVRLLLWLPLLTVLRLSAQCTGDYTWVANGSSINFMATTSPGVTNTWWDFGDGNYDYTNNASPTHTYAGPGPYTACIIVYDSATSCTDSTCHTVIVDSCYASISYTTNGMTANFTGYANGGSPNSVYVWNFGDSSPSVYTQNATHTYAGAGTYTVCFAYYDLVTGCADSVCTPVTIGGCTADFTWIDSLGYVFFFGNSSYGSYGTYLWDFGDATTDNVQYPAHSYANPGIYQVCLTVYDSMQNFCDSTCHMITINNVAGLNEMNLSLAGISFSPNPSDENTNLSFLLTKSGEATISVYDVAGREMLKPVSREFAAGKQQVTLDTRNLSPGIYMVQIAMNGQQVNSRMFVTHK